MSTFLTLDTELNSYDNSGNILKKSNSSHCYSPQLPVTWQINKASNPNATSGAQCNYDYHPLNLFGKPVKVHFIVAISSQLN